MATYSRATPPVLAILSRVMAQYHGVLVEYGVTVGLLAAWPGESDDSPVKLHGYACAAVIKVTPYKQRVQGIEDAVITLDGPLFGRLSDAERVALLDHELTHLELARDGEGTVKLDDHCRPKLKLRLHDWQLGGFEIVAHRHGPAALESQAFRNTHATYCWVICLAYGHSGPAHRTQVSFCQVEPAGRPYPHARQMTHYQAIFSWADDQAGPTGAEAGAGAAAGVAAVAAQASPPAEDGKPDGRVVMPDSEEWQFVPITSLGLDSGVENILLAGGVRMASELVRAVASGAVVDVDQVRPSDLPEIRSALDRFWHRLSKAQAESYEAFVAGIAPAPEVSTKAAPKRRRKVAS